MHVKRQPPVHDVVVIGSGAAGGIAAWNLVQHGVRVLLLDAGTRVPRHLTRRHLPWKLPHFLEDDEPFASCFLDVEEQPYQWADGNYFDLMRVWGRGGKMNVWGRVSLRYSDVDFAGPTKDGCEIPWPIRYQDLAPYYDRLDRLLRICGGDEDLDILPGSKHHRRPPNPSCGERLLQKAGRRLGLPIVPCRLATARHRSPGRSYFNPADDLIAPAIATGRLKVVNNAVCGRVLVDQEGKASGVQYFHRVTAKERVVRARIVVLAASCIDSTRILLNSTSSRYPTGIANSNDHVGRYLTEQVRGHVYGVLPELTGAPPTWEFGNLIYMPRFNHRDGRRRDYLRGFGMQFWTGSPHAAGWFANSIAGFGAELKAAVKSRYPGLVGLHPYGEVLPRPDNRVTVDRTTVDRYGLPIPRIEFKTGDNECRMVSEMYTVAEELLTAAKADILPFERTRVDSPGQVIHEHGTCRMGADPARSVVNHLCQSHEVPNLFVVDGAVFPTATEKNPTLTILALAWRATDFLAEELRAARL